MRSAPHRSNKILIPSLVLEFCSHKIGGGKGIRTPDLLIANETLYQLSYTPKEGQIIVAKRIFGKCPRTLIRRFGQNYFRGSVVSAKRRGRRYARSGEGRIAV